MNQLEMNQRIQDLSKTEMRPRDIYNQIRKEFVLGEYCKSGYDSCLKKVKRYREKQYLERMKRDEKKWNEALKQINESKCEFQYNETPFGIKKVDVDKSNETTTDTAKRVATQNMEPNEYSKEWDGTKEIKIAIIGDTQMGSKYTQLTYLNEFYDICKEEGIEDIYHTGDLTDGLKMRPGHEYELYVTSADDMLSDVVKNYPKRDGITTHFITGNHDASIYKHIGYDIGLAIANRRDDMKYLGRDCAIINLTDNCTLELRHPWDGTAYAISYKPQKMIESMESDSKPNILAIGHYHKAEYLFYRNVHAIQTGCFQSQTPFTRGKGISVNLGGWIVTIKVNSDGTIKSISPQFIPFYASLKNDYKRYITNL